MAAFKSAIPWETAQVDAGAMGAAIAIAATSLGTRIYIASGGLGTRRFRNEGKLRRRELRRFARRALRAVGLREWQVSICPIVEHAADGRMLAMPVGACCPHARSISLSPDLLDCQRYTGKLTALHEVAHALGHHDHGPKFMRTFADLIKRFMGGGEDKP